MSGAERFPAAARSILKLSSRTHNPMRVSKLFGKTLREVPAEAELASHRLMLQAGIIDQVSAGVYSYLPLAWRSLRKIEQIIRDEMDAVGGQELRLPALHPRQLWDKSGRADTIGDNLFSLEDRRGRALVMAPTHEELLTTLVKANVRSYRDLPLVLYQIQTKFRDEERPRGGLLRVREFDMKDAYSFHADEESLEVSYRDMVQAYKKIFERCGLSTIIVEADSGAIGGKDSQEFIVLADAGEDTVLLCEACGYAANAEKAAFVKPDQERGALEEVSEVHTPGVATIEELAKYLSIPESRTLKAVFYSADDEVIVVTIRGDLDVNEVKLTNALGASGLRLASPEEVRAAGLVAGSASPVGLSGIKVVADDSVELGSNFVVGANREDYHLRNANYPRDFKADLITDIALAKEGYACPKCETRLITRRGIEGGHVFKLGTRYSDDFDATFADDTDSLHPIIMGCYGIGIGRLLAAAVEQNHDEKGMSLPASIAPYEVWLAALNVQDPQVEEAAGDVYEALLSERVQVLYDDRLESAGVKLNDADLIGLPIRLVVSPRNLKEDVVEVTLRSDGQAEKAPTAEVVSRVKGLLGA